MIKSVEMNGKKKKKSQLRGRNVQLFDLKKLLVCFLNCQRIPKVKYAIKKIVIRTLKLLFWGLILQGKMLLIKDSKVFQRSFVMSPCFFHLASDPNP